MPFVIFMALPLIILSGCAYAVLHDAEKFGLNAFGLDPRQPR